jgi:transcriptional regulator with XRE-family HTH domain
MNHIREIRERQGLPQYRLAQALDRSAGWLWKIETGQVLPGPEDRRRIAEILSTPEADLFPGNVTLTAAIAQGSP